MLNTYGGQEKNLQILFSISKYSMEQLLEGYKTLKLAL